MKKLPLILALVGLAAAAVVAWMVQREPAVSAAGSAGPAAKAGAEPRAGKAPGGAGAPGGPGGPGGGPVAVEVGKAVATRIEDDVLSVGSLKARRSVMLRPEVSGRIAALNFTDGSRVTKGQLLMQLDDTLQQAQLQQAQAQASIARTNLQRSRELAAQSFVSTSAVDQNAAALDVAMAQVALAQAQVQRLRVLAPFDAVAGIRTAQVGDYVRDGADVVTLDEVGTLYIDFKLPERYVPKVKRGSLIEAEVDALPKRRFTGQVTALDSQVDSSGRALLVRAELRNPDGSLRSGMFARARLVFGVRERAILVPEEAITPLAGKQYLFKLVSGPNGGQVAERLEAKIGVRQAGKVEILEGLADGDTVVTAGQARLARGDKLPVRVVDIDQPASGRPAGAGGPGGAGKAGGKADGQAAGGAPGASGASGPAAAASATVAPTSRAASRATP
ncbi:MAG: efflux RND transporter periplasmic adaptor subunit [Rubrivivax sp.]